MRRVPSRWARVFTVSRGTRWPGRAAEAIDAQALPEHPATVLGGRGLR